MEELRKVLMEYLKKITDTDRVRTEAEIQSVSEISTKDLVYELKKREGVETKHAEPHKDLNVKVNGPAIVLIVTD